MKATGIVRKIDNLGRIVIPKEIRSTLQIKDNDSLEILINESQIILQKHSTLNNVKRLAESVIEAYYNTIKQNLMISDRDKIIATNSAIKQSYLYQKLPSNLNETIKTNIPIINQKLKLINEEEKYFCVFPIISKSITIGLVITFSNEQISESNIIIANIIAKFLGNQLED